MALSQKDTDIRKVYEYLRNVKEEAQKYAEIVNKAEREVIFCEEGCIQDTAKAFAILEIAEAYDSARRMFEHCTIFIENERYAETPNIERALAIIKRAELNMKLVCSRIETEIINA